MSKAIRVGDLIPSFSLYDQQGKAITFERGGPIYVLFFYPKDFTAVCTKEACGFRDAYSDFQEEGAEVFGISNDPMDSHQEFAAKYNLNFPLLSDPDGRVRKQLGIPTFLGMVPGRYTLVIDPEGRVRHVTKDMLSASAHVEQARKAVRQIRKEIQQQAAQ